MALAISFGYSDVFPDDDQLLHVSYWGLRVDSLRLSGRTISDTTTSPLLGAKKRDHAARYIEGGDLGEVAKAPYRLQSSRDGDDNAPQRATYLIRQGT